MQSESIYFLFLSNFWIAGFSYSFLPRPYGICGLVAFSVLNFRAKSAELCGMDLNILKSMLDNVYTCLRLWPLTLYGLPNNIHYSPHIETIMTLPPFEWQETNKTNWPKNCLVHIYDLLHVQNVRKHNRFQSAVTLNSPTVRGMSYLGWWRPCPSPRTPHWRTPAQQRGWGTWRRPRCPAWTFGPPREPCKVPWTLFMMRQKINRGWNLFIY